MRFNSKSVTLNRGVNLRVGIDIPKGLMQYSIPPDVLDESVRNFNKDLDSRKEVSEKINGIKVDVLRIVRMGEDFSSGCR